MQVTKNHVAISSHVIAKLEKVRGKLTYTKHAMERARQRFTKRAYLEDLVNQSLSFDPSGWEPVKADGYNVKLRRKNHGYHIVLDVWDKGVLTVF